MTTQIYLTFVLVALTAIMLHTIKLKYHKFLSKITFHVIILTGAMVPPPKWVKAQEPVTLDLTFRISREPAIFICFGIK